MFIPRKILEARLLEMLSEDVGQGDVTAAAIAPADTTVEAEVVAKEDGVAAGIEEIVCLAESLGLKVNTNIADGDIIKDKKVVMKLVGDARTILAAERTMLNLLSRMSGIATTTKTLTDMIKKANLTTRIAATRKTAPGLLYFDKKAVHIGGGDPHRLHLDDLILVKDNHIAIAGSVENAVKKARMSVSFTKKIEIEVAKPEEAIEAAEAGAEIILLDNFSPRQVKQTVKLLKKTGQRGRVVLEASGGIITENLLEYALAGADVVSLGELTHSVKSLDLSLEITKVN